MITTNSSLLKHPIAVQASTIKVYLVKGVSEEMTVSMIDESTVDTSTSFCMMLYCVNCPFGVDGDIHVKATDLDWSSVVVGAG